MTVDESLTMMSEVPTLYIRADNQDDLALALLLSHLDEPVIPVVSDNRKDLPVVYVQRKMISGTEAIRRHYAV